MRKHDGFHASLAEKLGRARGSFSCMAEPCTNEAAHVRFWPNPAWGFEPDGATPLPFTEDGELDFLLDVQELLTTGDDPGHKIGFRQDSVAILCSICFTSRLPGASSATVQKPDQSPTEAKRGTLKRVRQDRLLALELLGGKCDQCEQRSVALLQVVLRAGTPSDYWAQAGLDSWEAKYEALLEPESGPPLRALCTVRCVTCQGRFQHQNRTDTKIRLREQIVAGYGGRCDGCSRPADPKTVWLVRKTGTEQLRYPGTGRRMSTGAKYRALIAAGFPQGWALVCPECYQGGHRVG